VVDVGGVGVGFDRRLLGSNAPAWIVPARLRDPGFQEQLVALGTTVLRMPGGSWSDGYEWLACEQRDAEVCPALWAAVPSDFVAMLDGTGVEGMWTVSFNGTAQEAAALVAFFNGEVDDGRVIGRDRLGQDWGTVGRWARLRAEHGHLDPQPIRLWEVGNEIYGAVAAAGEGCAPWGWEESWTCDPGEYVLGDATHDGYLEIRAAMRAVDPGILVGAVGIGGGQGEWSAWGDTVIELAGDALDFYVVHSYGFETPPTMEQALARPQEMWPAEVSDARAVLDQHNPERRVPIAVTEYNLTSTADVDAGALMTKAVSALYIADTIGQMALAGVSIANQWCLVGGYAASGSDYGVFEPDRDEPNPQFYALALWSRFGDVMLPVSGEFASGDALSVYAGVTGEGAVTMLAINKTADAITAPVRLVGATTGFSGTADVLGANPLDGETVTYNGDPAPITELASRAGRSLGVLDPNSISYSFPAYSITLLELIPTTR
jgi:hypothetical protein